MYSYKVLNKKVVFIFILYNLLLTVEYFSRKVYTLTTCIPYKHVSLKSMYLIASK